MSNVRGRVLASAAVCSLLLGAILASGALGQSGESQTELSAPWPYCWPDASPPPAEATPWPPLPYDPLIEYELADRPLVVAIVATRSLTISTGDGADSFVSKAQVDVDEVVWQTAYPKTDSQAQMMPLTPGWTTMAASPEAWDGALQATAAGRQILIGIDNLRADGAVDVHFVLDATPGEPRFFGPHRYAARNSAIFAAFLSSPYNPLPLFEPREFLVAWNAEADAPLGPFPVQGPIFKAWELFLRNEVAQDQDYPSPGTKARWEASPPYCRTMIDAPASVKAGMLSGTVWVENPISWRRLADGVVCLSTDLASLGCFIPSDWEWTYYRFDALAQPGGPIYVQIAYLGSGGPSWLERVRIGTIPAHVFAERRSALVELDDAFAPVSYASAKADPHASGAATARAVSTDEEESLIQSGPIASPDPASCGGDCP